MHSRDAPGQWAQPLGSLGSLASTMGPPAWAGGGALVGRAVQSPGCVCPQRTPCCFVGAWLIRAPHEPHLCRQHGRSGQGVSSTPPPAAWKGWARCPLAVPLVNPLSLSFFPQPASQVTRYQVRDALCVSAVPAWSPGLAATPSHPMLSPVHALPCAVLAWPSCPQPLRGCRSSLPVPQIVFPCCWVGT